MPLQLKQIEPPGADKPIKVFRSWIPASQHLCDHVLTQPEAAAWSELEARANTGLAEKVDLADQQACFQLARRGWHDEGASLQPVYDLYAHEIELAFTVGWSTPDGWCERRLGVNGVVGIWSSFADVHSAYLPELGSGQAVDRQKDLEEGLFDDALVAQRRSTPLPRQVEVTSSAGPRPQAEGKLRDWRRKVRAEREGRRASQAADSGPPEWRRYRRFQRSGIWFLREALDVHASGGWHAAERAQPRTGDDKDRLDELLRDYAAWRAAESAARGE